MTREQLLDGLSRLWRATETEAANIPPLGLLAFMTVDDQQSFIRDGRFVVISRGMLSEIIDQLKATT